MGGGIPLLALACVIAVRTATAALLAGFAASGIFRREYGAFSILNAETLNNILAG